MLLVKDPTRLQAWFPASYTYMILLLETIPTTAEEIWSVFMI